MPAKEDLDKWWPEPVLETRSPLFELPAIGGTRDKPVDGTYLTSVSPPRTGAASRAPSRHPERRERVVAVGGLWRNASDDPCRTNTAASRTTTAAAMPRSTSLPADLGQSSKGSKARQTASRQAASPQPSLAPINSSGLRQRRSNKLRNGTMRRQHASPVEILVLQVRYPVLLSAASPTYMIVAQSNRAHGVRTESYRAGRATGGG